jgi:uncharacterized protein
MKTINTHYIFFFILVLILAGAQSCSFSNSKGEIEKVHFKARPFSLNQVELLDGPFKHATELDEQILLNYKPDRLLSKFRSEAGLKPKAESYKGWEDETIAGHSLGHYLSACSQMYLTTGNKEFLNRVNYIVDELEICQKAKGTGYIGASANADKIFENEISKGIIRSKGFDLNGLWAPLYTQHKELAGLIDAYNLAGNKKALIVALKLADWIGVMVSQLTEEQLQDVLHCEHGGINESFAELYSLSGDEKYLKLAQRFYHKEILAPMTEGHDILAGTHANTQIPKFIGLARIYEVTGDKSYEKTSEFFWSRVVHHHSYVTGGNCNHEYFGQPDSLRDRLSQNTTETCNVYNMLKLTGHLFEWEPSAEIADFYERALFNHILSSQHPENGHVIYNLSLEMGGYKIYEDPESFTCCVGTGMENHSKYGENIFYHNDNELYVSQFIASKLNWNEKGVMVKQLTKFPDQQGTTLEFECKKPTMLTLQIRYPYWAMRGIEIKVNDKIETINQKPGSFVAITREWKTDDKVEVVFPFSLRTESMPDDSNRIAMMYGPLVLAGDLGAETDSNAFSLMYVPVFMTGEHNPEKWIKPIDGETNTFQTVGVGNPHDVVLKPFYKTHNRRYSVYFDQFTAEHWKAFQSEYQLQLKEKKNLERRTIDFFQPGEMQPERDHNFTTDKGWIEVYRDRKGRLADRGGVFSFSMKVLKDAPVDLWVEFWGGYTGSKTFDILVEDKVVATENISDRAPGKFVSFEYSIPNELTQGKDHIIVTFKPHDGHRAGPVFGVRTLKKP